MAKSLAMVSAADLRPGLRSLFSRTACRYYSLSKRTIVMSTEAPEIIEVDTEDNVLVVKGAVPGPNGGYVVVRRAKR